MPNKAWKLRNLYKITQLEFERMIERQENKCAICENKFVEVPHIDHDHGSGKVRGLLCARCNRGIGHFYDNLELLRNAYRYVKRHQ